MTSELSAELGSGTLRSCGEVMTVMLQGLMSSKVELSVGVMREVWQGSELAEISQQCHVSVTGCNNWWKSSERCPHQSCIKLKPEHGYVLMGFPCSYFLMNHLAFWSAWDSGDQCWSTWLMEFECSDHSVQDSVTGIISCGSQNSQSQGIKPKMTENSMIGPWHIKIPLGKRCHGNVRVWKSNNSGEQLELTKKYRGRWVGEWKRLILARREVGRQIVMWSVVY